MKTSLVVAICTSGLVAACGGDKTPPPAAPSATMDMSDSGAMAMPSPAQSAAELSDGGGSMVMDHPHMDMADANPMPMPSTDHLAPDAGMMMGHMTDGGAAHHKMDHMKMGSKALDGGAPKKK